VINSDYAIASIRRAVCRYISTGTGGLVLSACQRSQDGDHVQLRVFNPDPLTATASLSAGGATTLAETVDFLDRPMATLPVAAGAATLTLRGHGIATVRLKSGNPLGGRPTAGGVRP